jgi:O-antigen ligase
MQSRGSALKLELSNPAADRISVAVERWLVPLVPVALVSLSGVADVFCSVLGILFLLRAVMQRTVAGLDRPWVIVFLILWIYLCFRSIVALRPGESLGEAAILLRYPVFAVAVSQVLRNADDRERLATVAAWSSLFLSVDAILQYCVGYDIVGQPQLGGVRLTGPSGKPRVGVTIAWLFLPPLLALVQRRQWLWAAALGCTSVLAIILSGERMALATLGLDGVGLLILLPQWRRPILAVFGAAAALLILVIAVEPAIYQREVASSLQIATRFDQSPYGVIWNSDVAIASEYPTFGVGMKNYRYVCPDPSFGPLFPIPNYPRCSTHPHNYYVEWLIAGGIPSLVAFVIAMGLLLRDLLVHGDRRNLLFAGLVATILMRLWPLAPTTSFFLSWSAIPLFLVIGWALSYLPEKRSGGEQAVAPGIQPAR